LRTVTRSGPQFFSTLQTFQYPLTLNISEVFASDGSLSLQTTSRQQFKYDVLEPFFVSTTENEVNSTDTLQFDSSFNLTGHNGQQSSQKYKYLDSRGADYSCELAAQNNTLTSVSDGCPGQK
jgi:hypothetical protein